MFVSLMFRDWCSCIYTWVNLNLKRTVSGMTPFLLTENVNFRKFKRKLAKMQKLCKSASFLLQFRKITLAMFCYKYLLSSETSL